MASLNKVILIGNLGRDPELKYLANGDAVCNFSIATSESWKDKNGERNEKTEWHNITLFRKQAEAAAQYLKKGNSVYIEGKISTRKWQDKDGKDRISFDIIGSQMTMLGKKNENDGAMGSDMPSDMGGHDGVSSAPARTTQVAARPANATTNQAPRPRPSFDDIPGDDIPF